MGAYDDVLDFLNRVENPKRKKMNTRKLLSSREVKKLEREFPGVPPAFLDYLREVGAGSFRECQFTVYGSLSTPEELYDSEAMACKATKKRVLCFGDDYSESTSCFLPGSKWAIVEVTHSGSLYEVKKKFPEYIRDKMLMGPNGEDLRG